MEDGDVTDGGDEVDAQIRERILERISKSGLTQVEVARRMRTTPATVSRVLHDKRSLTWHWIRQFAAALDCRLRDLVDAPITVAVVGYVGAGEKVVNFDDLGQLDRVEAPSGGEEAVAVIVRGESMLPKYEEGTLLYYFPVDHVADDCIGKTCVVQVKDGPTLVKKVRRGSRAGLYRLISTRAAEIEDVELVWAARVRWTEEP